MINGFLNIDKAPGMTSHDVVAQVRRLVGQKRVGHGGTLDPLATGVLPVGLGEATRLLEYLVDGTKCYEAVVQLGTTTTTDDAEGAVVATEFVPPLTLPELQAALAPFIGTIQQIPPMYSAIQVGGRRLHELARQGQTLELAPRTVTISRIEVVDWQAPEVHMVVECGKGTYIRALARDLGASLGCGAHLATLRRTKVGPLAVDQAVTLDQLRADPSLVTRMVQPPAAAVADWPQVVADEELTRRIRHGLPVDLPTVHGEHARAHAADGTLIALLKHTAGRWHPFKVFGVN